MELEVGIAQAALNGLLSFASPCVLPLVPPYLGFIAGASLGELKGDQPIPGGRRRIILSAVAFVLGFATVFTLLGAGASAAGQAVQANAGLLTKIAGGIIILMGLHFLGVIRIPVLNRQFQVDVKSKPVGLVGAFLVGLAFAFGWSPCAGPFLATVLFTASKFGDPAYGALLLFIYAMGIGIPFILAAVFASAFLKALGQARRYMPWIERAMGVVLVITGGLFLTEGGFATIGLWLYEMSPEFWSATAR